MHHGLLNGTLFVIAKYLGGPNSSAMYPRPPYGSHTSARLLVFTRALQLLVLSPDLDS